MPLYAGVCETNITPPLGVWMSGYGLRPTGATRIHDELYARAVVIDDGTTRLVLISADIIVFAPDSVERLRSQIASFLNTEAHCIMLHATHTHGGPYVGIFRCMGEHDTEYMSVLERKIVGCAKQAAQTLYPVYLTYGETTAQIGVKRRQSLQNGRTVLGHDYAGVVAPKVQTLNVNHLDGRLFALLFSHACHPTTMGGENLAITAEWCGAAVEQLKNRFRTEENTRLQPPLPIFLQGCCGDINPNWRGSWESVEANGKVIADAAHQALWNAHGRLDPALSAEEVTVNLPMLEPPSIEECDAQVAFWEQRLAEDRAKSAHQGVILYDEGILNWARDYRAFAGMTDFHETQPFTIQRLTLGGIHLLGFPAEMFVQYQLDFAAQSPAPVFSLAYTNGCWNYLPTSAEYPRGGYEVLDANKYYGTLMFAPESEATLRDATYRLLGISEPDTTPYPLLAGLPRA
ncbi:MAG: neutral/alkaline non-lysosomal ceramidase N-terminal domain-containing protein [Armatimonadetes bacterium]|nr:neutral/alkaline non-lysosomal ceramidase N-terminal domain-containing protein [Armatimonadota bacterium]